MSNAELSESVYALLPAAGELSAAQAALDRDHELTTAPRNGQLSEPPVQIVQARDLIPRQSDHVSVHSPSFAGMSCGTCHTLPMLGRTVCTCRPFP